MDLNAMFSTIFGYYRYPLELNSHYVQVILLWHLANITVND
jgi:hypothetical protein